MAPKGLKRGQHFKLSLHLKVKDRPAAVAVSIVDSRGYLVEANFNNM